MTVHKLKKGLNLPITGAPEQSIADGSAGTHVALMSADYPYMKPQFFVEVGDTVKTGQLLFKDRKSEGVQFTSPGAGKVTAINRGARRAFQSVVIELDGSDEHVEFENPHAKDLSGDKLRSLLAESGLWTAFRTRPHNRVPSPTESCHSIFVTAIDTNPLAASVDVVMQGKEDDFALGVKAIASLTDGKTFVCKAAGSAVTASGDGVQVEEFSGPHPAGLVGTHIHFLDPVHGDKVVWHIGYQDVIAIGRLLKTGKLDTERVVALAGPAATKPRLLKTRLGASIDALTQGEVKDGEVRVVSGSALYGEAASGDIFGFLGRYHGQVTCLEEDRERLFFGWVAPGADRFSTVRSYLSAWFPGKKFPMGTSTHGGHRANVPIGMLERVMPLDIMPTFLVRALLAGDIGEAEALGCLELAEEDLALCTFVSPGKEDFGVALRKMLTTIWKEG